MIPLRYDRSPTSCEASVSFCQTIPELNTTIYQQCDAPRPCRPNRHKMISAQILPGLFQTCGSVFSASGLPSSSGRAFPKQKNTRIPGPESPGHKGKESKFKVMEDGLTLVLVIVLCLVLRPLISAILRGIGSSEHRRDR